jgi:hypothetical protein
VPGADYRYLALCVLMTSEQKVNSMAEETGSRFLAVDETETSAFIDSMKNENTQRKTRHDVAFSNSGYRVSGNFKTRRTLK